MDNVGIIVDDLKAAIAFFTELGLELEGETTVEGPSVDRVGEVIQYENMYRLCYLRGPEGILVALAERLGT